MWQSVFAFLMQCAVILKDALLALIHMADIFAGLAVAFIAVFVGDFVGYWRRRLGCSAHLVFRD
jgi:membrane protein DedA with SNARE-associated domain